MQSTPQLAPDILAYYARGGENVRLREGPGRLELWRTQDILGRVLPPPHGLLLDVGGGSGVHAAWLAEAGWRVELIDPVPNHVAEAAKLPGVVARQGDARALPLRRASAEVVLLLGPLYHLLDPADRHVALTEAARVARPGGLVVVATINRAAPLHDQLNRGGWFDPLQQSRIEQIVANGHNPPGGEFTTAYFHHPAEIAAEMTDAGLEVAAQHGVEGAAWLLGDIATRLDDEDQRADILAALRITESDPALIGVSSHLLTVAHRPAA